MHGATIRTCHQNLDLFHTNFGIPVAARCWPVDSRRSRSAHLDFLDFSRLFLDPRNRPQTAPMRSSHRPGWMMSDPVPGNFFAAVDSDILLLQHMIEKPLQAGGAARMTCDAQMHADGRTSSWVVLSLRAALGRKHLWHKSGNHHWSQRSPARMTKLRSTFAEE
jgi:hypothetical protein